MIDIAKRDKQSRKFLFWSKKKLCCKNRFRQYSYKDPIVIIKKVLEILPAIVEAPIKLIITIHRYSIKYRDPLLFKYHPNTTIMVNMQIIL